MKNSPLIQVNLQVATKTKRHPTLRDFKKWVGATLLGDKRCNEKCSITIRLVDRDEITELNAKYRKINRPTNILSFNYEPLVELSPKLLGDIVICAPIVNSEATEQNHFWREHWAHLTIHGVLHLLGYDHDSDADAEVMENMEKLVLDELYQI